MPLFIDLIPGDGLDIDSGRVYVTVEDKSGRRVRLRVDAEREIPVIRKQADDARGTGRTRDHPPARRQVT